MQKISIGPLLISSYKPVSTFFQRFSDNLKTILRWLQFLWNAFKTLKTPLAKLIYLILLLSPIILFPYTNLLFLLFILFFMCFIDAVAFSILSGKGGEYV